MKLNELQWAEMAGPRWWARVYQLIADTGCSIEQAIKAIRDADQEHTPTAD